MNEEGLSSFIVVDKDLKLYYNVGVCRLLIAPFEGTSKVLRDLDLGYFVPPSLLEGRRAAGVEEYCTVL